MPFYTIRSGEPYYRVGGPESSGSRYLARESDGTLWASFSSFVDYPIVGQREQITVAFSIDGGLTWTSALVFEDSNFKSSFVRILVDSEDTLHLTCHRQLFPGGTESNQYTSKTKGGSWQALVSIPWVSGMASQYQDEALDSANNIHRVTANISGLSTLVYDYKPCGGAWQPSIILDTGTAGWSIRFANICVDNNDTLHITYTKGFPTSTKEEVFYISRIAGVWQGIEQATTYGLVDENRPLAIAVTSDGIVYSPFNRGGGSTRCVRRSAAGVWTNEAAFGLGTFRQGHLTINPDGTCHFAWHRLAGGTYWYREDIRTGGVWAPGEGSFYSALTINSLALGGLWANWPQIDGVKTNIPHSGWCCVAGRDVPLDVAFYLPAGGMVFPPGVTTDPATDIRQELATLKGTLGNDGGEACNCSFQWGLTVAYGNTTPTQSKVTGESFSQVITGLSCGTIYHFRALATNSAGTIYGADETFTTLEGPFINKAYALAREEL